MRLSKRKLWLGILIILILGLMIPQRFENPVENADNKSYHSKSFWFYPLGKVRGA
jgi:hypothetical protein